MGSVGFERRQYGFFDSVGGSVGSSEDNVGFPTVGEILILRTDVVQDVTTSRFRTCRLYMTV